ncbi:glycosyltransferase [Janthinobacterium sp. 17J80-10]|uniref:glycosyltransferase n=1 Tax=Janthinobacterium sp. 17J80-10 TaxID=2497863 RepID=UPI00100572D3|nr:glycosyltransferase [Janthinobacterium sp. 17J80-10]QAU35404.1 glycosyltransferase [Janthinobacterium sp. 17J80-10]
MTVACKSPLASFPTHQSSLVKAIFSLLAPHGVKGKLTILVFHKIPPNADPLVPDELVIDRFEPMLDFLKANFHVMFLGEAVDALAKGTLPGRALAITFDDGYADWLDTACPALLRRNLPATFFITTEQLSGQAIWHERILAAVRALPDTGAVLPYGFSTYAQLDTLESRIKLTRDLQERLKYVPLAERLAAIDLLEAQRRSALVHPSPFTADSVRAIHNHGFEIGAHTVRHPILNECTTSEAIAEIGSCREELEAIISGPVTLFAYPNGRPGKDFNNEHADMVKAAGYKAAVATHVGVASASSDPFQLPRFSPWGSTDARMAYQLARNMVKKSWHLPGRKTGGNSPSASEVRCLMIASTFPPIHGGSAVVYENLCARMPTGSIRVLSAKFNYLTNREISDWHKHDKATSFPVERTKLLRPLMMPPPANIFVSLYRLLCKDVPLYARIFLKAARIVRRHDINIVCIGELVTGSWIGIALRKFFGTKLIIYVHGEEITTATGGRLHGMRRQRYLAEADKVVAVSAFTCDALTHEMSMPPNRISLIQNGVDTDRFTPGPPVADLIARHNLLGKKIILTVGRLVPRKGVDKAIMAMSEVRKKIPEVHYLVVGDGDYRAELVHLIAEHRLSDCITLVGKVSDDELVNYLRTCDIFLMPNRTMPDGDTEGFGLVFREANACRKPVIGGRAGGAVEAVIDGKTGMLVNGTDPQEIAGAIIKLFSDPRLVSAMSDYGYRIAQENNTQSMAEKFLTICERLLREHTKKQ